MAQIDKNEFPAGTKSKAASTQKTKTSIVAAPKTSYGQGR